MDQNIQIAVRIKPSNNQITSQLCNWDSYSIQIADKNIFSFDCVVDPNANQQSVFQKVGLKVISNVLEGYNGCIFAYGQTGSGKTYTMTGYPGNDGIVQRCLKTLWNCVKKTQFFQIKLSYFEIYNETIKDLLNEKQNLTIRQNSKSGFYVENLTEKIVSKYEDFQQSISHGISARTVKQTKMNQLSSRSHSVLQISLSYKNREENTLSVLKNAKITFIDLAGSQKQKQTQVEGQRLKQAANINKSLSTLSLVIGKLSEQSQRRVSVGQAPIHVPYRNSVLTKILKNSLVGKSKIIIVCTVSLEQKFLDETISTLRFAQTAKSIKIKVNKNEEEYDGTKQRLFEQFRQFKQKYSQLKNVCDQFDKENQQLKRQNAWLKDQIQNKQAEINQMQVSMECIKLQSQQIFNEMRSHSQFMSQTYGNNQFNNNVRSQPYLSETSNKFENNSNSSKDYCNEQFYNGQFQNSQSVSFQNRHQNNFNNQCELPTSQLSFFTSNLSSPKNSFFTIKEQDSKQQNEDFLKQKINRLEAIIKKLQMENDFFKFDLYLQEQDIKELTKKIIYLENSEKQIQEAYKLFDEMVQNKNWSFAQLNFLNACLKNSQKDKLTLELVQQQKKNQNIRFNQAVQRIKELLFKHTYNSKPFQKVSMTNELDSIKKQTFFKSPSRGKPIQSQNIDSTHNLNGSEELINRNNLTETIIKVAQVQKKYPFSFNKKKQFDKSDIFKKSQTPMNFKQSNQSPFFVERSQFIYPINIQSSQLPQTLLDSRTLRSQTSNKFTNNQLEYLKKDYQKMSFQIKQLKEQDDRNRILLLEKDSLLQQKQQQFDECVNRVKILEQQLDTHKHLLQISRNNINLNIRQNIRQNNAPQPSTQLIQKEKQLQSIKTYLLEIQRKNQYENNSLRLKYKQIQITLHNNLQDIKNLSFEYNKQTQRLTLEIAIINKQLKEVKKQKQQMQISLGILNSENTLLTERYNYLKSCMKKESQLETPKKNYSKNSSFFSVSQQQKSSQNHPSLIRPKQLTEQQCIQVIQNKTFKNMYQAAYYFYKKSHALDDAKTKCQSFINSLQNSIKNMNEKFEFQIKKLDNQLLNQKKQSLRFHQMFLNLKSQKINLEQNLYNKQKQIDQLLSNEKRTQQYSHLLATKLKEKNQKQLQARQKAHNLSAQLRDHSLTPNYIDKNRFNFGQNRLTGESEQQLVTNGDTPNFSPIVINQNMNSNISSGRRSIQVPRFQIEIDQLEALRKQIQQISCQNTTQQKLSLQNLNENDFSVTQSLISHTENKKNLIQALKVQNIKEKEAEIEMLDRHQIQQKQNKSKATSIKSEFTFKNPRWTNFNPSNNNNRSKQ